jgi:hypothetical protein
VLFCLCPLSVAAQNRLVMMSLGHDWGGIEGSRFPLSAVYTYETPRLALTGGVQLSGARADARTLDLALDGGYFFQPAARLRLGAGLRYHLGFFRAISVQHDFFAGGSLSYRFLDNCFFNWRAAFFEQILVIPALGAGNTALGSANLASSLSVTVLPADRLRIEVSLSSYELFRYNLFATPALSLSAFYQFKNNIVGGFSQTIRYTDMFTVTAFPAELALRFYVGYRFK